MDDRTRMDTRSGSHGPRSPVRYLAWLGIGLGAAELLLPQTVARVCGLSADARQMRRYGLRELACGIGLLGLDASLAQPGRDARRPMARDYSDRTGYLQSPDDMRGAALETFRMPPDMRGPEGLRPWQDGRPDVLKSVA